MAKDWPAVVLALASLALVLSPLAISPFAVALLLGPIAASLLHPVLLIVAAGATVVACRSTRTRPAGVLIALLLAFPVLSFGVLLAYSFGTSIPVLFQEAAIVWPQFIFFGPTRRTAPPANSYVVPYAWAGAFTVAVWGGVAWLFGRLTRRWTSFLLLAPLATLAVVGTVLIVKMASLLLGWRFQIETP